LNNEINHKPYELLAGACILQALNEAIDGSENARRYLFGEGYHLFNSIGTTQIPPADWIMAIQSCIAKKKHKHTFLGEWS